MSFEELIRILIKAAPRKKDKKFCHGYFRWRADINKPDFFKRTPLMIAISNGYVDIVEFLLKHRANPEAINERGTSCI